MTQDTWFMLENTPRPGEVHPSLALTHEGRRVPPSLAGKEGGGGQSGTQTSQVSAEALVCA